MTYSGAFTGLLGLKDIIVWRLEEVSEAISYTLPRINVRQSKESFLICSPIVLRGWADFMKSAGS